MTTGAGGIVCGGSVCPTCNRPTETLIGPCNNCTEHFHEHGKFPRKRAGRSGHLDHAPAESGAVPTTVPSHPSVSHDPETTSSGSIGPDSPQ